MAVKTPADRALADVEKAINDEKKAQEKYDIAQAKADELLVATKRAKRELAWRIAHPDLPEDFSLDEFRKQLEEPFEGEGDTPGVVDPADELEQEADAIGDAVESGEIDPDELEVDDEDPFA